MGLLKVTGRDSLIKTKTNKKNRLNMQVLTH